MNMPPISMQQQPDNLRINTPVNSGRGCTTTGTTHYLKRHAPLGLLLLCLWWSTLFHPYAVPDGLPTKFTRHSTIHTVSCVK